MVVGGLAIVGAACQRSGDSNATPEDVVRRFYKAAAADDCSTILNLLVSKSPILVSHDTGDSLHHCAKYGATTADPAIRADDIKTVDVTHRDGQLAVVRVEGNDSSAPEDVLLFREDNEWKLDRVSDTNRGTTPHSLQEYAVYRVVVALNVRPDADCETAVDYLADSAVEASGMDRDELVEQCENGSEPQLLATRLDGHHNLKFGLVSQHGNKARVQVSDGINLGPVEIPVVREGGEWQLAEVSWAPAPRPRTAPPPSDAQVRAHVVEKVQQSGLGCFDYDPTKQVCTVNGGAAELRISAFSPRILVPGEGVRPYDPCQPEPSVVPFFARGNWKGKVWEVFVASGITGRYVTPDRATTEQVAATLGGKVIDCPD